MAKNEPIKVDKQESPQTLLLKIESRSMILRKLEKFTLSKSEIDSIKSKGEGVLFVIKILKNQKPSWIVAKPAVIMRDASGAQHDMGYFLAEVPNMDITTGLSVTESDFSNERYDFVTKLGFFVARNEFVLKNFYAVSRPRSDISSLDQYVLAQPPEVLELYCSSH